MAMKASKTGSPATDAVDAEPAARAVGLREFFRFASTVDMLLMSVGAVAALALGALQPLSILFFGQVIDTLGNSQIQGTTATAQSDLRGTLIAFIYVGVGAFVAGFVSVYCFKVTGERQVAEYRRAYLRAILRQDVGWHDARATSGLASAFAESTSVVQAGIGTKLSEGLRFLGQGIGGLFVSFYFSWQIALLMVAFSPIMMGSSALLVTVVTSTTRRISEAFASAGAVCAEVLGSVRTVASFAAEEREVERFDALLKPAEVAGIGAGWRKGLAFGSLDGSSNVAFAVGIIFVLFPFCLKWLRQQIGMVGQEPVLFDGTIAQNIAYGKPGATQDEIDAAARTANAFDFIAALPDGFATRVAQGQLSGGQKQRVAIARAVIKKPVVLILDEATSALDTESERVVQAALDALLAANKRTTLVIAHRLSTIRNADKIAYVGEGRVLEEGTHDQLLRLGEKGKYAALVAATGGGGGIISAFSTPRAGSARAVLPALGHIEPAAGKPAAGKPAATADVSQVAPENMLDGEALERQEKKAVALRKKEKSAQARADRARIFAMQAPERGWLALAVVSAIFLGGLTPFLGYVFTELLALFFLPTPAEVRDASLLWGLVMIGVAVAVVLLQTLRLWGLGVVSERLTRRLRAKAFASMLRQEMAWFDKPENSAANLSANLTRDVTLVAAVTGESLGTFIANLATIAVGISLMFIFGAWQLALVALCAVPIIGASLAFEYALVSGESGQENSDDSAVAGAAPSNELQTTAQRRKGAEAERKKRAAAGARASERAASIVGQLSASVRTVASFGLEGALDADYAEAMAAARRAKVAEAWVPAVATGVAQVAIFGALIALYAFGAFLIQRGEATFKQMFVVLFVMFMMAAGLGQFAQGATDQGKAVEAVSRILAVLDRKSKLRGDGEGTVPAGATAGRLEFKNVVFAYPQRPHAAIYTDFCLTIEPGQTVALVGGTGSGKSTAVQLLERFYDPSGGSVLLDGADITTLQLKWLRQQIGMVGQEPVLFDGTIAENIAYGKPGATQAEIEAAARSANAHGFIMSFPAGFETRAGQGGGQLSGGQKQRVAIARAVIKNPIVLILDEATSALDTESERVVQAALDALLAANKRTTLVIAHRLSTIRNADKIAYVGEGRVLEKGTHDQLLRLGEKGKYAALVRASGGAASH
ncbi:P-loop containing nucleoside triphosphate hydrolase protein [Pavlovales sp. CCMP2436]|nr:P-loop containing nucleoside triphosphate hydrolase protein [Pavlovales sp. CCMP2436]